MEIMFNNIKYKTVIQLGQDAKGNRRQVIEGGIKTITIASKGIREHVMAMNRELVKDIVYQNSLAIQRGFDSLDSQVTIPRALLEKMAEIKQLPEQKDEEDC